MHWLTLDVRCLIPGYPTQCGVAHMRLIVLCLDTQHGWKGCIHRNHRIAQKAHISLLGTQDTCKQNMQVLYPKHFTSLEDQTRVCRMESHYTNHCTTIYCFKKQKIYKARPFFNTNTVFFQYYSGQLIRNFNNRQLWMTMNWGRASA